MAFLRSPFFWLALALVGGLLLALSLWLRDHDALRTHNPRHRRAAVAHVDSDEPRLVRFLASTEGPARWGVVVEAPEGVPERVVPLDLELPGLEGRFDALLDAGGFDAAERLLERVRRDEISAERLVPLAREELATRLASPIDVSIGQLEQRDRLIVGVGFNYDAHAEDSDAEAGADGFVFAKHVVPTGAYAQVPLGPGPDDSLFAPLVDYEVELAFVLLEPVRLDALPAVEALAGQIAWVHANDVSDRRPIIAHGDAGFTVAKSRPGYLPLGPWLVHGRHFVPRTSHGGLDEVELSLEVEEAEPHEAGSHRQHASSREMVRGPREILDLVARVWQASERPDGRGVSRGVVRPGGGSPTLPRGTLLLTGTPSGTAIEAPQGVDKLRLFLLGNLSTGRARAAYLGHCVRERREMGFLSPGDLVDATIGRLGRQRWEVVR
ncbi:MAG: fumarylacetoacetate hydrolase family protein [Acidobacteria bacterium]|nr:fumarylacetoacetate hydrolase family protein [Acidobacteriota bacterium]